MTDIVTETCLDAWRGDPGGCSGPVEYHSVDPGVSQAWPRCEKHWAARLDRMENSIEKYIKSDVPPGWFDPTYAGEEW